MHVVHIHTAPLTVRNEDGEVVTLPTHHVETTVLLTLNEESIVRKYNKYLGEGKAHDEAWIKAWDYHWRRMSNKMPELHGDTSTQFVEVASACIDERLQGWLAGNEVLADEIRSLDDTEVVA